MTAFTSKPMLRIRTLLLLQASLNLLFSLVAADCYWADGSNAYNMQECYGQDGADGLCCMPGDSCLLNHLCQSKGSDTLLYRGACNMPNWTEAATCPQACTKKENGYNVTDIQIIDVCYDAPGFFACDIDGGHGCFHWNNPVFLLPGCLMEYNTAGNPRPVADMPSCPDDGDPSLSSSTTFDIGPDPTFTHHSLLPGFASPLIRASPFDSKDEGMLSRGPDHPAMASRIKTQRDVARQAVTIPGPSPT